MGLISLQQAIELTKQLHNQDKTVVVTNGCFDILHVGHVRYLQKTKSYADVLILLLNSDVSVKKIKGDSRPINNQFDRAELLSALSCVDYVVLFDETSPANILKTIKPDVYTKGADYNADNLPEADILKSENIKTVFIDFVDNKSTTELINKIKHN